MAEIQDFPDVYVGEILDYNFDFSAALGQGETVSSSDNWTCSDQTVLRLSGSSELTGAVVLQKVEGLRPGSVYVRCYVDTDKGERLLLLGRVTVVSAR